MLQATDAASIRTTYLKLLVTQLSHQNPLEPMSSSEMTNQLTGLSQLEQMESMNTTFAESLRWAQLQQATGLIGRTISYLPSDGAEAAEGQVTGVDTSGGEIELVVGQRQVPLAQVETIR